MTISDDKLQGMIGASIDPSTLRQFDTAAIAEMATARSRRRRLLLTSSGLVAAGVLGSAAAIGGFLGQEQGGVESVAPPRGGPAMGCGTPAVSVEAGASGTGVALKTTGVGILTRTEAVLKPAPQFRVERGVLIVAKPGSTGDAGDPSRLPSTAALRAENQLAVGTPVLDAVPAGQALEVNFKAATPGRYPVFAARWFYESENCAAPAPAPGVKTTVPGVAVMQLGEIVVE